MRLALWHCTTVFYFMVSENRSEIRPYFIGTKKHKIDPMKTRFSSDRYSHTSAAVVFYRWLKLKFGFTHKRKYFVFRSGSCILYHRHVLQSRHVVAHGGTRTLDQSNGKRKSTLLYIVEALMLTKKALWDSFISIQFTHATADTAVVASRSLLRVRAREQFVDRSYIPAHLPDHRKRNTTYEMR